MSSWRLCRLLRSHCLWKNSSFIDAYFATTISTTTITTTTVTSTRTSSTFAIRCFSRRTYKITTFVDSINHRNYSKSTTNHLPNTTSTLKRTYASAFAQPSLKTMKLDTPEFKSLFTPELAKLSELFDKYDYEIRIAGGAVRDLLMGKVPHDIDFATTATPSEMKEMFEKEQIRMINAKGEKHGTITARINDKANFEVTTLRIDVITDGRHAEVEFTKDWQLDANRRDLTINSLFLGLDGTVFDYFNGVEDLRDSKVRFVGDADTRIIEDFLRILRYFRFFGRIVKSPDCHDPQTLESIKKHTYGLENISGERLWMELKKIVTGNFGPEIMQVMLDCGVGKYLGLDEIVDAKPMKAVFDNCRELNPNPTTVLSSILSSKTDVEKVHKRLKLSNDELHTGQFIVEYREEFQNQEDKMRFCKAKAVDLHGKDPKIKIKILELLKYFGELDLLRVFEEWQMPRFPVSGKALVLMGVKGPMFTKILTELRRIWIESEFQLEEQDLLSLVDEVRAKLS